MRLRAARALWRLAAAVPPDADPEPRAVRALVALARSSGSAKGVALRALRRLGRIPGGRAAVRDAAARVGVDPARILGASLANATT